MWPPSRNISVRVINCKFKKMSVTVFVFVSIYNYTDCIGVVLSLANVKLIWFVLLSPCDCIDLIVFLFTNIQSFKLVFAIVQSVSISIVLFKYTDCFGKMHKLYHKCAVTHKLFRIVLLCTIIVYKSIVSVCVVMNNCTYCSCFVMNKCTYCSCFVINKCTIWNLLLIRLNSVLLPK